MDNRMQRLELEDMLSQVYSNNFLFEGSSESIFSFDQINFITLNSVNIYIKYCDIIFHREYLNILIDYATIEIKYSDISYLSISFSEA